MQQKFRYLAWLEELEMYNTIKTDQQHLLKEQPQLKSYGLYKIKSPWKKRGEEEEEDEDE